MKKIGLLCLALVLALGTLGVGYAMWFDEVTIEGTVETGSVEISIESLSETYVYKDLETGDIVMSGVSLSDPELLPVANATAEDLSDPACGTKRVKMTFTNIFPTEDPISADVLLHYTGTIPAHVVVLDDDVDSSLEPYLIQTWLMRNEAGQWVETEIDGIQLHYCNRVWLVVSLNGTALQRDGKDAQGLSGNFTKTIIAHQWNEPWPVDEE